MVCLLWPELLAKRDGELVKKKKKKCPYVRCLQTVWVCDKTKMTLKICVESLNQRGWLLLRTFNGTEMT